MSMFGLDRQSLAFSTTILAVSMMNSIFMFYYMKVYMEFFHVSDSVFQAVQFVYMIWNAINDPWFAYLQDNVNIPWVRSRRLSIKYGAPFFALSFVIPWFPWGDFASPNWLSGLQLLVALCFYDAVFTYVLLAHCALFAEISTKQEVRIRLTRYCQAAGILGSNAVFVSQYLSNNLENFRMFQLTCVGVGIVSVICLLYAGTYAVSDLETKTEKEPDSKDSRYVEPKANIFHQIGQIFSQRNFIYFGIVNFFQVFQLTFSANFTAIVCDQLVKRDNLSDNMRSIFYGGTLLVPQMLSIVLMPMVMDYGYHEIFKRGCYLKILGGVMAFLAGQNHPLLFLVFILVDSCITGAQNGFINMCVTDIIDADVKSHKRKRPLSSTVFGCNAIVTKPSQSLAPMLVVALFNAYGYGDLKAGVTLSPVREQSLHHVMFTVTCLMPVVTGVLQLPVWSLFTFGRLKKHGNTGKEKKTS